MKLDFISEISEVRRHMQSLCIADVNYVKGNLRNYPCTAGILLF